MCARRRHRVGPIAATLAAATLAVAVCSPAPAAAFDPLKPLCKVAQFGSGALGKACGVVSSPGKILSTGKKLATGHVGGAVNEVLGGASSTAAKAVGLAALGAWVLAGASFALHETATLIGHTTSPQLISAWFSSAYWRMGAIAALLTLPFLFAAAVQALARSDLALLVRAAFGYLPLALIAVGIAAPLTMLLLAATDQLSAVISSAAGHAGTDVLTRTGEAVAVASFFKGSPFLAFLVGLLIAAGALVVWLELLMREAAVYIVVLMLPIAFASMVWPARRIWAVRAVEVLVALILAKFAIVAVLALGGAALDRGGGGINGALAGLVLVVLGAFAPWALLRLLPLTELASGAAGSLRSQAQLPLSMEPADSGEPTGAPADWARVLTARMGDQATDVGAQSGHGRAGDGARAETGRLGELEREPVPADALMAEPDEPIAPQPAAGSPAQPNGVATMAAGATNERTGAAAARSPHLDPMWHAPDLSWRPLTLEELGNGPLSSPLWDPPAPPAGAGEATEPRPDHHPPDGRSERRAAADSPGEDHTPLPPEQEPEGGSL